jgi:hypothetical protein
LNEHKVFGLGSEPGQQFGDCDPLELSLGSVRRAHYADLQAGRAVNGRNLGGSPDPSNLEEDFARYY